MVGGLISGICGTIISHVLGLCGPVIGAIANIIIAFLLAAWGEISGLLIGGVGGGLGGGVLGGVGGGVLGGLGMGTIDAIISLASEVIMAMLRGLISGIHIPW